MIDKNYEYLNINLIKVTQRDHQGVCSDAFDFWVNPGKIKGFHKFLIYLIPSYDILKG